MRRLTALAAMVPFLLSGAFLQAQSPEPDPRDPDDWRLERLLAPSDGPREGETIRTLYLDIDGDGNPEYLSGLSQRFNGKMGNIWSGAFAVAGHYRLIGAISLRLNACGVFVEPEVSANPRLYAYWPYDATTGSLVKFTISGGEIIYDVVKRVRYEDYRDKFTPLPMRERPASEVYALYSAEEAHALWADPATTSGDRPPRAPATTSRQAKPDTAKPPQGESTPAPMEARSGPGNAAVIVGLALGLILLLALLGWTIRKRAARPSR